ncbi:MAG: cheA, partial [Caulobacteraceae bacterium]|nr:cheA [Caulobacteraceae bacterium]
MDPLAAIKDTFFQECEEQLAELESGLLAMEAGETDSERINAVFRAVHSIKGGAGAFSLEDLIKFAHVFETALDEMRSNRLEPRPDVLKIMLRAADVLADLVRAARDDDQVDQAHSRELAEELRALGPGEAADEVGEAEEDWGFQPIAILPLDAGPTTWTIVFRPRADLYAKANETAVLLRELRRLGEMEVALDAADLPPLDQLDPEAAYLTWTIVLTSEADEAAVREVFEFVEGDCDLTIAAADGPEATAEPALPDLDLAAILANAGLPREHSPPLEPSTGETLAVDSAAIIPLRRSEAPAVNAAAAAGATIRVDLERVDRLIDLVGELVINQAMLSQRV